MNPALFVHVPAHLLPARLPFLLNRNLQPEVACQEVTIDQLDFQPLGEACATLATARLGCTLHAPFNDFNPGSGSRRMRKNSHAMALKALELAKTIGARKIIFHPGLAYGSSDKECAHWLQHNIDFWPEFIPLAESSGCCICLENIYETVPDLLLELCQAMASPCFGHCFDIGHWNVFGQIPLPGWLDQAAPYLKHLHLHDNFGEQDEHLPIGKGNACFNTLFDWLRKNGNGRTYTLEAHNLLDLDISLSKLKQYQPDKEL